MTTKEFAAKLREDRELFARVEAAASVDECYAIAKENGLTDSLEEFKALTDEIRELGTRLTAEEAAGTSLNLADVAAVAGGSEKVEAMRSMGM